MNLNGFAVRFSYDSSKIQPSNIESNEITDDETQYFKFVGEFENVLELFTIPYDGTGDGINAVISFIPPVTESEHIEQVGNSGGKVINTEDGILLGKMSFQMQADKFDESWLSLQTSTESSPKTGISINIDGISKYEAQNTFRFIDKTASKNANLSNIVLSSGIKNEVNPEQSTYKEYSLTPEFEKNTLNYEYELLEYMDEMNITAILEDAKSSIKLKVPKRDEENNLLYENDGTTILYEEKEINDNETNKIILNKLGEPDTKVTIIVTSEDGQTNKEYTITIKRPYGTVKGKIFTEPTSFTTETYIAEVLAYSETEVEEKVNWETAINNTKNNKSDDLNTVFRGNAESSTKGIEEKNKMQTNDDGTFELYLIPGKYTLLIDKKGYLDQYYINVNVADKDEIDLSSYETSSVITLIPGDINKDGAIGILDKTIMTKQNGKTQTDLEFNPSADLNDDDLINITDKTILTKNNNLVRKIINLEGGN